MLSAGISCYATTGITSCRSTKEGLVALQVIWCHAIGDRNASGKLSGAPYERSQACSAADTLDNHALNSKRGSSRRGAKEDSQ